MFYSAKKRGFFHPDIHADMPADAVEISDDVHAELLAAQANGHEIVPGKKGKPTAVMPEPAPVDLMLYAKHRRNQREAAGTTVDGHPIGTDRETRSALLEAKAATDAEAGWSTPWALANGRFITIDAEMLARIIPAVAAYRRDVFVAYEQVVRGIEAGDITTVPAIDAAFDLGSAHE